mmetsp:Transcript_19972/g.29194  ORF Transcript_19972/g.29194 Transcript_19972/m.29194 type:complete len:146 (+) Transcript_19972:1-438(+)
MKLGRNKGYFKMMSKPPKESLSLFRVLKWEHLGGLPVTRLELVPISGRTHQLRVHCAAIGHPIIGDNIYGFNGVGSPYGGLSDDQLVHRVSNSIQRDLFQLVQRRQTNYVEGRQYNGNLCLHAKQLNIFHPITKSPMAFEVDAPF